MSGSEAGPEDSTAIKTPRLSAQQLAALKPQGQYMGVMRDLPAAKWGRVKRIRAEKGIRAAIAEAGRMAG